MKINNVFLKKIIDIVEYGSFSKPILNYIESNINDISLKYYISLLKSKWKMDFSSAIYYANKSISTTTTTTILKELSRYELVLLYSRMNNFDKSKKVFNTLKNNISNISPYARRIIIPGLKAQSEKLNQNFEILKCYGDLYEESYVQKAIIEYSKAGRLLSEEKYDEAYNNFLKGFSYAKKFNHPSMMCAGLNSATWWIRNEDKKKALITANLLEYYIGYYFDDFNYISNWIDTIISVKELNNDIRVFGLLEIIHNALILFPDLKIFIENMQCPDFKIEEYTLNKKLNYFIYKKSKKRLKSKTLNVVELKRFIQKYGLTYKKTYPYEIKNELYKIYINKIFKENIIKFKKKNKIKILELFLATYSSLIEKPSFSKNNILGLIFEGDKDKIIKYFSSNYEKMYFFNLMFSNFQEENLINNINNKNYNFLNSAKVSLFYIARKNLILKLLKNVRNKKEFIVHYFNLSDREKNIFDIFLRNCVRYDIKWPITPYPKGKVRDFAIKYGLGQKRVALGYYSFEDNERLFLDSIIEKFLRL